MKTPGNPARTDRYRQAGFTLIEIVMVVVILGILAATVIPRMSGLSESSRVNATRAELLMLKRAIIGNPSVTSGGRYVDVGFEGNVGHPPVSLEELGTRSDSLPVYDAFSRVGWNGPYLDTAGGDYLTDAWGSAYMYDRLARTIMSVGGSDTILVSF